jgi:hypothetical protein
MCRISAAVASSSFALRRLTTICTPSRQRFGDRSPDTLV